MTESKQLLKRLARYYVHGLGLSYADAARVLGISASALNQIFHRFRMFVLFVMNVPKAFSFSASAWCWLRDSSCP